MTTNINKNINKNIKNNKILRNLETATLLIFAVSLVMIVIFAEHIAPFDPFMGNLKEAFIPPNSINIFGTDRLGRDIFSRVIYGIRISLVISLLLVFIISTTGGFLGIVSGYIGGFLDKIIMQICNILISCPSMVLAIALAGIMGASTINAMIAIFVVMISKYIRLTRSLVLRLKNEEYIKAAKMSGTSNINIIKRHIVPNIFQTIIVTASVDIGTIILELSALSFLGFGIPAPYPELGYMINDSRPYLLNAPYMIIFPGLAIFFIVSVCNLISDKIRIWLE